MSTRLDRLFLLLDTGSTPVIRKSAAEQLGEVQKLHPHELNNLLSKVHQYLGSSSWETRIAASQAIEAISRNVPPWEPKPSMKDGGVSVTHASSGHLRLSQFSIQKVLTHGASLLASEGQEFEEENISLEDREKLSQVKQQLNKRLGLDVAGGMGINTDDLYMEEDLCVITNPSNNGHYQSSVKDLLQQQMPDSNNDLSAREKNRAKRKARMLAKQTSRDTDQRNGESDDESAPKLRKTSSVVVDQPNLDKILLDNVPDDTLSMEDMEEWPFESLCEMLMNDLFHSSWEKRHGSAMGLRDVINLHGSGAGIVTDCTAAQMLAMHESYLEDIAVRLVCVLALDRFGDFISDEVVAPVRETCAQALGVTIQHLTPGGVEQLVTVMMQLLTQQHWEVRHGGLLGLKYLLAVRRDLTKLLLPRILPGVFLGLEDKDDDVRAVAAAALLPVAEELVLLQLNKVQQIIDCLWNTLLDLDDLTSSTNSIMLLLSTLLAHPKFNNSSQNTQALTMLIPRLWPFLRHNISSVRLAALKTLSTLVQRFNENSVVEGLVPILQDGLRHIYQRSLLESSQEILAYLPSVWDAMIKRVPTDYLVMSASPWMGVWMSLMMQPTTVPFDNGLLISAEHAPKELTPSRARHIPEMDNVPAKDMRCFIGGSTAMLHGAVHYDIMVIRARHTAARLLGSLCALLTRPIQTPFLADGLESPIIAMNKLLMFHLQSKSANQRFSIGLVITEWAKQNEPCQCSEEVQQLLHRCLAEPIYFDEIGMAFTKIQTDSRNLIAEMKHRDINMDPIYPPGLVLTLDQARALCTQTFETMTSAVKGPVRKQLDEHRNALLCLIEQTALEQQQLTTRVQASLACAAIWLRSLPEKMNPVVRPVMDVLKKEYNYQIQMMTAQALSQLCLLCIGRDPCPTPKIIKNLVSMLCCDSSFTPLVSAKTPSILNTDLPPEACCDQFSGILTLYTQQLTLESGRGRKGTVVKKVSNITCEVSLDNIVTEENESKKLLLIQRQGATRALKTLISDAGPDLLHKLPNIREIMFDSLENHLSKDADEEGSQSLVQSLQVLEICGQALDSSLHPELVTKLPFLCQCLEHKYTAVRHMAARCLGILSKIIPSDTMNYVLENVLSHLGTSDNDQQREGAIEALSNVITHQSIDIVPYIVLLVVPIMGCMSDQLASVRLLATSCFATLIRLMPLESGIPDPPAMKQSLVTKKEEEREFLLQLLDNTKSKTYKISVPIDAELRKYQQDGVNWLAFLNKYRLHGILCDDMGLGKTIQSLCILAGDHFLRHTEYTKTKHPNCAPLPSIVVCPPTLTGHWVYEVEKFVKKEHLNPLHYHGPPSERQRLQKTIKKHNLVIASYDVVRNDIDFFGKIKWNYCILDEGHIIKNSKTKISKSVKQLPSNHRLILSGTPIQNNVLELWSLFDFLMPGFLGTEKQFQARYGKPILQSRDAKSSSKEQEAGALAMEALHRQVLPFVLRRLKDDVLKDLPPKIIQDYYCDLSPLQVKLYEDFAKSRAKKSLEETVHEAETKEKTITPLGIGHIFQAMQYLRKVCNHPSLVLTKNHPEYNTFMTKLKQDKSSLNDLQHAPKLLALKQLLLDCGIGLAGTESCETPVVNQHRVLLFCQLKSMLDIVEKDLLKVQMPSVTYLRLDGSVPPGNRHGIVNRFNGDPSIDILLLTTHVGGLGLNLTGADTVIFVEHDWNPMKDLQAMDRAHRIGQKKVVNVYRLITRGTLEEKIMGLQKFKMKIANSVITQDNSSLASMGTDQLLDLFSLNDSNQANSNVGQSDAANKKHTVRSVIENLDELWEEKQYENAYDLDAFMETLNKR